MWNTFHIEGRKINIFSAGKGFPYIYCGVQENSVDFVEKVSEFLTQNVENLSVTLVAYEAKDWNAEFSPWKAPAIFAGRDDAPGFAGKGQETLDWLTRSCIPYVEKIVNGDLESGRKERYLAGYSLAGLFSLWGFYESRIFRGCVSGSGSLWFPGWDSYVSTALAPEDSHIYLSLGGKEERTKNPVMATIGDATRSLKKQLEQDANVTYSKLEWNSGGHFAEPEIRMAKGIAWILEKHLN